MLRDSLDDASSIIPQGDKRPRQRRLLFSMRALAIQSKDTRTRRWWPTPEPVTAHENQPTAPFATETPFATSCPIDRQTSLPCPGPTPSERNPRLPRALDTTPRANPLGGRGNALTSRDTGAVVQRAVRLVLLVASPSPRTHRLKTSHTQQPTLANRQAEPPKPGQKKRPLARTPSRPETGSTQALPRRGLGRPSHVLDAHRSLGKT